MSTVLFALTAWLTADFLSGLAHWIEDRALTGQSRFAFVNALRADNERHHRHPSAFLASSWWSNLSTSAPFAWIAAAAAAWAGLGFLALTLFFLGFGALTHRWAHDHLDDRPVIVIAAQRIGLLLSPSHHAGHHFSRGRKVEREEAAVRFCALSNWLNPVLDRIGFWTALGKALRRSK